MNQIEKLEQQLNEGIISDCDLDVLFNYHKTHGEILWNDFILEKRPKNKAILKKKRDDWEKTDNDFWKLYADFLIFKNPK